MVAELPSLTAIRLALLPKRIKVSLASNGSRGQLLWVTSGQSPFPSSGESCYLRKMEEDELFRLLKNEIKGPIYVCDIAYDVAEAIQAHTYSVLLSRTTVEKQEAKRRPGDIGLYLRAPEVIQRGFVLIEPPHHALFIYHERTDKLRSYKAVVKSADEGYELYLKSIHRVDRSSVRATFRKAIRLTEWKMGRREVGPPKNPT